VHRFLTAKFSSRHDFEDRFKKRRKRPTEATNDDDNADTTAKKVRASNELFALGKTTLVLAPNQKLQHIPGRSKATERART